MEPHNGRKRKAGSIHGHDRRNWQQPASKEMVANVAQWEKGRLLQAAAVMKRG
jgi:hypothetical protein